MFGESFLYRGSKTRLNPLAPKIAASQPVPAADGRRSVTKPVAETKAANGAPPLSPSVRRHLGKSLRSHYADSLTEPVSERLETLIGRLDAKQDRATRP